MAKSPKKKALRKPPLKRKGKQSSAKKTATKKVSATWPRTKKPSAKTTHTQLFPKQSEAKLKLALQAARMGIWDWDLTTNQVEWSDGVHEIFGLERHQFDGSFESYAQMIHPDDKDTVLRSIEITIRENKNYYVDHRIVWADKSVHWVEGIGQVILNNEGKPIRMTGTVRDATQKKAIEREREDWKTKFSHIANSSGIVIYDYNIATGDIIWSGRIVEVLGYETSDMGDIGQWEKLIHPSDRKEAFEKLEQAQQSLSPYDVKYRFKRRDNSYCLMHDRGFFIAGSDGTAERMLGMMQDISMFEEAAIALRESESRFEKLIFDLDVGVLLQGPKAEILLSNKAALKLLGVTEDQLHGRTSFDPNWNVIHEDGSPFPGTEHPVPVAIATLKPVQNVIMGVYRPDTQDRTWLLVNANPLIDLNGNLIHVICSFTDISDRKKIEEELIESEQRFRILQQASFGGIAIHSQGVILDCNQGLCNITGYTREELVGMNGLLLIAEEFRDHVRDRIISGYELPYDAEGIRKDGSRYVLDIQGKNIPYKGLFVRVTEFRDITIRKRAEQSVVEQNAKLTALTDDLKRKNEQLEEFTQIVSHNLRSPVGNILTLSGFLQSELSDDERREYLSLLKESGQVTLTMLNDLNEVLKIKQNKNIERSELVFEHILQQTRNMLSAQITETSAIINHDFSKAPSILYPRIYLESIILNLISNALKYCRPKVPVKIDIRTYVDNGNTILEVKDNGLGINLQKYGHHIFKMRKTFHKHPESRGIGLFMIKNQIEAMGGEITLTSKENEGTTFYINFNKHQQ